MNSEITTSCTCWTCGTNMKFSHTTSSEREICSNCGTPNIIPKQEEVKVGDELEQCFFCNTVVESFETAMLIKSLKLIENPKYRCVECNLIWEEVTIAKGKGEHREYKPICQSCQSNNTVPAELPAMPIGKYYENFRHGGIFVEPDHISPFREQRKLTLTGYVKVPRCLRCKGIHKRLSRISFVLSTVIWVLVFMTILFVWEDYLNLLEQMYIGVGSFFLVWPLTWFMTKFIFNRTIGKGIRKEADVKFFPAVQSLRESDWNYQRP